MEAHTLDGRKLHLLMRSTIPSGYAHTWQRVFTSAFDITAKVTAEENMARAERHKQHTRQVQAIAALAGGIAHQFNNALSAIYCNLDLLEVTAGGQSPHKRPIDALRSSSHRIGHLTEQLLAYAQGGKYQPRDFPIKPLIEEVLHRHWMVQSPSLKVTTCFEGDLVLAGSDVTQIKMVLEAVLANAAEAMDNTGEIVIHTFQCEPPEGIDRSEAALLPQTYVRITIEDHGHGMDTDTRERLFEPFFSTKFVGRGLGMAAAFGIVRNHDGIIDVASEPRKGTRVMIYLPCALTSESQPAV
jgi:signal transduction histidine kinase